MVTAWTADTQAQSSFRIKKKHFESLPKKLELQTEKQSVMRVTSIYTNRDIKGNFLSKSCYTGHYTRLDGDRVKWTNVHKSESTNEKADFPVGKHIKYMDNFEYSTKDNVLADNFFEGFPQNEINIKRYCQIIESIVS